MNKDELASRLKNACSAVIAAQDELTEIDSHFGDADHGVTMTKIAEAVEGAVGAALAEAAPEGDELDAEGLKQMLGHALEELAALSKAKVGDKTMMDALIPATEAALACPGSEDDIFAAAAKAALEGAEASRNVVSKFGRARSYGEATIGTPDAGAVSMSRFFAGLAEK